MKFLANYTFPAILLVFIVLHCNAASAEQENPQEYNNRFQLPNDTEQKASYCLAVTKLQQSQISGAVDGLEQSAQNENNPSIKKILMEVIVPSRNIVEELNDKIKRLQLYLLPRMSYLEPSAMLAAYTRGEADFNRQSASGTAKLCANTCQNKDLKVSAQCIEKCMLKDDVNRRIFQCKDLSFLPY